MATEQNKKIDEIDEKLDELHEILADSKKSLDQTELLHLKLDRALEEIGKLNSKIDALYDPEKGIFPRIKDLETWKARQEEKEKTTNKIVISSIIAIASAIATTLWNLLTRK